MTPFLPRMQTSIEFTAPGLEAGAAPGAAMGFDEAVAISVRGPAGGRPAQAGPGLRRALDHGRSFTPYLGVRAHVTIMEVVVGIIPAVAERVCDG